VLISQKSFGDEKRWVYLDIGKFNGLAETADGSIKVPPPHPGPTAGRRVRGDRGPTCDSADILYEKADYSPASGSEVGDKIEILSAGAYTTTYASVGFNGFPPIQDPLHR